MFDRVAGVARPESLSLAQARRIALAAQGFGEPRLGAQGKRVDRRHLHRVLDRVDLVQVDSINVCVRSQEMPLFSRLGPHRRDLWHQAMAAPQEVIEYWCHEACFRSRTVLTGALAGVRRGEGGEILNAVDLTAEDVVGERVLCPGCRQTVFASWPEGWDAHAAHRCGGAEGATRAARKDSFKRRFAHLFR